MASLLPSTSWWETTYQARVHVLVGDYLPSKGTPLGPRLPTKQGYTSWSEATYQARVHVLVGDYLPNNGTHVKHTDVGMGAGQTN